MEVEAVRPHARRGPALGALRWVRAERGATQDPPRPIAAGRCGLGGLRTPRSSAGTAPPRAPPAPLRAARKFVRRSDKGGGSGVGECGAAGRRGAARGAPFGVGGGRVWVCGCRGRAGGSPPPRRFPTGSGGGRSVRGGPLGVGLRADPLLPPSPSARSAPQPSPLRAALLCWDFAFPPFVPLPAAVFMPAALRAFSFFLITVILVLLLFIFPPALSHRFFPLPPASRSRSLVRER